ncbi:polysaccharide pyruvyl transferase family protein [Ruminiclostridium cellobioparum]|uniref:Polysaccharide pyruvyl transferase n=1 Tax=Ruminiclostridium cellobioparum subsp. termitidis CT1112 TaxID=1195236 RepID=S0FGB3_RUMCE|nr:polysaccharide pyruvyl transferase family protein [Ruminiclostridium cellobioparum]EMS70385.1 Polysaccharide pyruvyl transferase [Ruminiclostridium cellobioparum subsp. termitidis CT1112]
MKYGLLVEFGAQCSNYGDYVQSIAIEYLYEKMDIPKSEIIYITAKELSTYNGEELLLPYSYVMHLFVFPEYENVKLSKKIIPVFLGGSFSFTQFGGKYPLNKVLTLPHSQTNENTITWLEMFRKFAPIGCRDEFTYKFIAAQGIPAYLQGCITNIFPCRPDGNYKKTFFVDCTSDILPYVPKQLLENAEVMTNYVSNDGLSVEENYQRIKQRYDYYRDNAALVVTSRYHVATPCNAMGIPCIFINRKINYYSKDIRLDTLNPYIQLYSSEDYSNINWYPQWQDFSELKEYIAQLAIARIREVYKRYTETSQIRKFFQTRIDGYESVKNTEVAYKTKLRDYIQQNFAMPMQGRFYIWGAIQLLCDGNNVVLANLVNEINPNLEFVEWIDTFKSGILANKPIRKPDELCLAENEFVIVAAETAVPDALNRFNKMQLSQKQFLILSNTMIEESDLKKIQSQTIV